MKRPLLMVALVHAGGIVLADLLPVLPSPFLLLALAIALAAAALVWPKGRLVLVWLCIFVAGAANLARHQAALSPHDLRTILPGRPEIASVRGRLVETPYHRVYEHHEERSWRTLARVDVQAVKLRGGSWQTASGRVAVSTPDILGPEFFGGREVEIEGVLRQPRPPLVDGIFDYRKFLSRHRIYHQLQVSSTNDWKFAVTGGPAKAMRPLADRFGDWAKAALARGLPEQDQPLQLLWAMALGWKTALSGEVSEPFMRSGTMHVFAISGLHIALIAGLLVFVLRVFRVPRAWCAWLVVPLLWGYTGATGWQASAIRSTIMMSVILGGWTLRRPSDLMNSLAAAAFVILLWDPQQLFQAGFQLSFLVVFSLALFVPLFEALHTPLLDPVPGGPSPAARRWIDRITSMVPALGWLFPDPLVPSEVRPAWQRWATGGLRRLLSALTTSLAAWIGSIPVIACYFHLFTPVSLLANLVVVPLSSAALACNLASLATVAWLPWAAELFNHAAWLFMLLMIRLSEWSAQLPAACWHVATPSPAFFAFYYATLVCVMAGWLAKPRIRWWAAGGVVSLGLLWLGGVVHERSGARLAILPLNGGEAVYHQPAGGAGDLLIDCGNEPAVGFALKPFLRSRGVNRPDRWLLTHGDIHNVGGAQLTYDLFPARRVYLSGANFRSTAYREAVRRFERVPGLTQKLRRDDQLGTWTVLHPEDADSFPQADDNTVVLHGDIEGVRVLLLSDLGKPGQNALMTRHPELRADIVVSGLPAQSEPLADALIEQLQPQLIVITDTEMPSSARASSRLRERLAAHGRRVLYTHETGAVTLRMKVGRWTARTAGGETVSIPAPEAPKTGP